MNLTGLEDLSMIGNGQDVIREISALEGTVAPNNNKRNFYNRQTAAIHDCTETAGKPFTQEMLWKHLQQKELSENVVYELEEATEEVCNQFSLNYQNLAGAHLEQLEES